MLTEILIWKFSAVDVYDDKCLEHASSMINALNIHINCAEFKLNNERLSVYFLDYQGKNGLV